MKTLGKRWSRMMAVLLTLVLMASPMTGLTAEAAAFRTTDSTNSLIMAVPNQTVHVSVSTVIADELVNIQLFSINAETSTPLLSVSNLKLLDSNGNEINMDTTTLNFSSSWRKYVTFDFDLTGDEALKIGYNTITISGIGYELGDSFDFEQKQIDLITLNTYTSMELENPCIIADSVSYSKSLKPGESLDMRVAVKNEGDVKALNTVMVIDYGDSGIVPDYAVNRIKVGDLASRNRTTVAVPIRVLEDATPGLHVITITFTCKNKAGEEQVNQQQLYITIEGEKADTVTEPELTLTTEDNYKEISPDSDETISIGIENTGDGPASNITVTCTSGLDTATGITKRYTTESLAVKNLKAGKSATVEVPFTVGRNISEGLHELNFTVSYTDASAKTYEKSLTIYLVVPYTTEETKPDLRNYITISGVTQSPAKPTAGEKVSISFDLINNGTGDIDNLRVYGLNMSSAGFEPVSNEPYQSIGAVACGAKKHITMTFKCGENITSGMNVLQIGYDYIDANGSKQAEDVTLYVLDVVSRETAQAKDVGRPKLIVNAYGTDQEILRAGEEFEFSFTLKNTHAVKAAKNIKITLTQDDGVFAPATGTNIFYIDEIPAGEESVQTMTLKTRADASTGDYTIRLLVEYEYDDMSEIDTEKGGVSEENTLKLRATENYRPVISNLYIETWDTVYVGSTVDMGFEFYNMGKSTLGNVYVTVEGDFELANNSTMSYIGAVSGYGQEYVNPQIVPLVAGEAVGTLTVHFEDSNGDEVTVSQEFSCYVEDQSSSWEDPGYSEWEDPGYYEYEDPYYEEEGEETGTIFGIDWRIVVAAAVVVIAVIVVVIVVAVKKSKNGKAKETDDEDY